MCGSKIYILVQVQIVSESGSPSRARAGGHAWIAAGFGERVKMESVDEIASVLKRDKNMDFLKGSILINNWDLRTWQRLRKS